LGSGVTITRTGGGSATTDSSGNYTLTGVANGSYTVTPSKTGFTFTPTSKAVTVNGANVTAVTFTATQNVTSSTIMIDSQTRKDQANASSTVISPTFSTTAGNELLLAFISADYRQGLNTTVRSVSGGGLTWVLVTRTQVQKGTAEIWRAFATAPLSGASVKATLSQSVTSSMTVMSFTGVDPSGTNGSGAIGAVAHGNSSGGAPTATLVTTRNNSLVVGVGNDPKNDVARTAGPGQTLVHQYLDSSGNTYWMQMMSAATPVSGSRVTINDSAPTRDAYNLSLAEILVAPAGVTQTSIVTRTSMKAATTRTSMMAAVSETPADASSSAAALTTDLAGIAVTNACSPGGLVAITGSALTDQSPQTPSSFPLPTQLAGLQVAVNGIPAPILFASDSQVKFQCPLLAPGTPLEIALVGTTGSAVSTAASTMLPAAPELFTYNATNQGVVLTGAAKKIAMLADPSVPSRPAQPGEILTIYASGLGDFAGILPAGAQVPSGAPILLTNHVRVIVGGVDLDPISATLAPNTVGLSQVEIQLPAGVPTGPAVPLYLQVVLPDGTVLESNEVTVAIDDTTNR
jgi:uncharacterized protein (TIGR03437 family)